MKKKKPAGNSAQRAEDILKLIRSRGKNSLEERLTKIRMKGLRKEGLPKQIPVKNRPMSADGWQVFKKNFVEEYGNEKVKDTGMTDSEFLDYFSTGNREGYEPEYVNLTTLLGQLREDDDK